MLETGGPYGGGSCASTNHSFHRQLSPVFHFHSTASLPLLPSLFFFSFLLPPTFLPFPLLCSVSSSFSSPYSSGSSAAAPPDFSSSSSSRSTDRSSCTP